MAINIRKKIKKIKKMIFKKFKIYKFIIVMKKAKQINSI